VVTEGENQARSVSYCGEIVARARVSRPWRLSKLM